MLLRASGIIGLPVFTLPDGKKIETVSDVIYHPKDNRIEALLIDTHGWFSKARVLLFEDIRSVGTDAVLIDTANVIKLISAVQKDIQYIAKSDTYLTGTRIITEEGINLGTVTDIYFNSNTGVVEEFEVSQGTKRNLKSGKKRVRIADIITIGQDATIVRVEAEKKIEEQAQGLQGVINKSKEQAPGFKEQVKDSMRGAGEKNREQTERFTDNTRIKAEDVHTSPETQDTVDSFKAPSADAGAVQSQMQTANRTTADRRRKDAVGLYLTKNILTPEDQIIAREGQMVTNRLLEDAEAAGVLDQILNNVAQRIPLSM